MLNKNTKVYLINEFEIEDSKLINVLIKWYDIVNEEWQYQMVTWDTSQCYDNLDYNSLSSGDRICIIFKDGKIIIERFMSMTEDCLKTFTMLEGISVFNLGDIDNIRLVEKY